MLEALPTLKPEPAQLRKPCQTVAAGWEDHMKPVFALTPMPSMEFFHAGA